VQVLDTIPFAPDAEQLLRAAHLSEAGEDIAAQVRELVAEACRVARPKAVCEVCYLEAKRAGAVDFGGVTWTSRVLRANLDTVERVFVHVATCGTELAGLAVPAGDFLLDYCLDLIKQQALNAAHRHLSEYLADRHALGKTAAMGPGSLADWPITEQTKLFSVIGDVERLIGVTLTESCLMIPNKSISGIIYPTEVSFTSCQLCPREVCSNRRAAFDAELAAGYGL